MKILIIGAAGMLGAKLAARLCQDGHIGGGEITHLCLADIAAPAASPDAPFAVAAIATDFSLAGQAERLIDNRPDVIFHLAAIVSGEAETDLEKGYRINLDGTRSLFDAIRTAGDDYRPRVVFASSLAVFGAPFPDTIPDDFHLTPLTSYGTQKAMCELLLADYTRRGFLDGIGLRLPTIVVRPGRPNKAASGFFSGIIREPLNGEEAVLPVSDDVLHWMASPRAAVGYFAHAAGLPPEACAAARNITLPGLAVTVAEQIETLRKIGGTGRVNLIRREKDPLVEKIVSGWPRRFDPKTALGLGFQPDATFEAIVRAYIEDEQIQV
ncbi:MAG: SDR family oxidoreductase [Roseibium sp.]|nr:SDR family oxidoreductase [Roseibium sp.]